MLKIPNVVQKLSKCRNFFKMKTHLFESIELFLDPDLSHLSLAGSAIHFGPLSHAIKLSRPGNKLAKGKTFGLS